MLHIILAAVSAAAVAVVSTASPANAVPNLTDPAGLSVQAPKSNLGLQEAKRWKVHKCKPVNKGVECEIKRSATEATIQEAKLKKPKIHKCKPVNKGVECEIKVSQAWDSDPTTAAAKARAQEAAKAQAAKARNDEIVRQQQKQREQEQQKARELDKAEKKGRTG